MFKRIKTKIQDLENRLAVIEFEKEAKGCTFIVTESPYYRFPFPKKSYNIYFLSKGKTREIMVQMTIPVEWSITQNGKYLEFWSSNTAIKRIVKAMRVVGDQLVDMDVDVYNKAFYPKKENPFKRIVEVGDVSNKAKDALDALTYIVESEIAKKIITKS